MFEKLENFRDFGGVACRAGRVLSGQLFRSAHHAEATDADLETLQRLGVSTIVDLRHPSERRRFPSRRHPAFRGAVIETAIEPADGDRWISFLRAAPDFSAPVLQGYLRNYYRASPYDPGLVDTFGRFFQAILTTDGPILIHCMGGKDRTGVLAGLTLAMLGVAEDDLVHDYLLTNQANAAPGRAERMAGFITQATGRSITPDQARTALDIQADFLGLAFAAMRERHGSVEGYLEAVLGLDVRQQAAIHDRLVAREEV